MASILLISTDGHLAAFRRPGGQAGIRWGTATGGRIAAYTVVDAYAVKDLGVSPVIATFGSNLFQAAGRAPVYAREWKSGTRTDAGAVALQRSVSRRAGLDASDEAAATSVPALAVGVLSPLAYILVLMALGLGAPLSVVAPAREMSMMVGALLGMVVLREVVGRWRLLGCRVLIAGVVLLGQS